MARSQPYIQKIIWQYASQGYRKAKRQLDKYEDQIEDVTDEQEQMKDSAQGMSGRLRRIGTTAKAALATAAVGAITAVTAALGAAAREAAKFNSRLKEVGSLMEGSVGGDLDRFAQGIDRIRRDLPVATDLTKALYDTISAGIDQEDAIPFLRTAAEAGVAGVTDTRTAVDALTSALNAYGLEASEAEDVSDTFFTAVKAGKTTFGELSSVMGKVLPIASTLGVDLEEVNSALATLTKTGLSTKEAGTALRSLFNQLIQNTKEFEAAGIDVQQVLDERGLLGVLREVQKQTGGNAQEIRKLFRDVEGLNAVLSLAGEQSAEYAEILQAMQTNAGATAEAVRKMDKGATALWKTFKNRLSVAARNLGETILPTLNQAMRLTNSLFGDAQASALERFLSSIQQVEGVDPQVEAQLRATINLRQAKEQLEQAKEDLSTDIVVGVDLTAYDGQGDTIEKAVSELSKEELKTRLQAVNEALSERAARIARLEKQGKEVSDVAERRRFLLQQAQEGLLKGLEIRARAQAATQAQTAAQERLNEALKDQPDSGGGGEGSAGFQFPQAQDVAQLREAQAAELEKIETGWKNVGRVVSNVSTEQISHVGQITDMMGNYRDRIRDLRYQLKMGKISQEEFNEAASAAAEKYIENIRQLVRRLEEMGLITEEVKNAVIDGIDEMQSQTEDAGEGAQEFINALDDVAKVASGLADAANTMGLIGDEAEQAIDNVGDLLGQLQRILEVTDEGNLSLDLNFDSATSIVSSVGSIVGILGTASQIIGQITQAADRDREETLKKLSQKIGKNVEALEKNTEALFENAVVGEEVSQAQLQTAQDITDFITSEEFGDVGSARREREFGRLEGTSDIFSGAQELTQQTEDFFAEWIPKERGGGEILDASDMEQVAREWLFGDLETENITQRIFDMIPPATGVRDSTVLEPEDLRARFGDSFETFDQLLSRLQERFGEFGNSMAGVSEEIRFRREQIGQSFDQLRGVLSGRIEDVGLSGDFAGQLSERIAGSSQEELDELRQNLAEALAGDRGLGFLGPEFGRASLQEELGDVTPEEFRTLIQQLGSLSEMGSGGGDRDTNITSQVQNTITEFQANELLAYQQGQLLELRKITSVLQEGLNVSSVPSASELQSAASGGGDTYNVQMDITSDMGPEEIAQKMEQAFQQFN
jgi:TP901 family phage tail tape measure protein